MEDKIAKNAAKSANAKNANDSAPADSTKSADSIADSAPDSKNPTTPIHLYKVRKQGKGAVIREAFALINADIYIIIDADTQYDCAILPSAIRFFIAEDLDMLNIARSAERGTHRKGHALGNKLFSLTAHLLFNTNIKDLFSGYRIFSKAFVKSFPAHSNGFEIESELTIFALQQHLRIDEISAPYKPRPEGSFSKLSTFKDGFKIALMILYLLFTERPLLVFGILSVFCFALGLLLGIPIILEFLQTSKVPRFPTLFACVGLGIIGIVLGIAGLLAFLIAKQTKESRRFAYLHTRRTSSKDCD